MRNCGELRYRQKVYKLQQTTENQNLVRTEKDQLLTHKIELEIHLQTNTHQKKVNRKLY